MKYNHKNPKNPRPVSAASINRDSGCGRYAMIFLAIAVAFRFLGLIQRDIESRYQLVSELILPAAFCVGLLLCLVLLGKHLFRFSLLPGATGVLFFVLRSLSRDNILCRAMPAWEAAVRMMICLLIFTIYSAAVLRNYRLKWVLVPVFALCGVYHLVCEGYPAVTASELKLTDVMMELSVLFMLAAFFFIALGFRPALAAGANFEPVPAKTEKAGDSGKDNGKEKKNFFTNLFKKKEKDGKLSDAPSDPNNMTNAGTAPDAYSMPNTENTLGTDNTDSDSETTPHTHTDSMSGDTINTPASDVTGNTADFTDSTADYVYNTADAQNSDSAPVLDESFFEEPYKATLTLDP